MDAGPCQYHCLRVCQNPNPPPSIPSFLYPYITIPLDSIFSLSALSTSSKPPALGVLAQGLSTFFSWIHLFEISFLLLPLRSILHALSRSLAQLLI